MSTIPSDRLGLRQASRRQASRIGPRGIRRAGANGKALALAFLPWLLVALPAWAGDPVIAQLARADSAFAAGRLALAEREYAAVLSIDPDQSRAIFQLARLAATPAESERLLRRYVALEPRDPWGMMALGDVLGRASRWNEALALYDEAYWRLPADRDAAMGRARLLAGAHRTDAAIAAYESWVGSHPADAEAWSALGHELQQAGRLRGAANAFEHAADAGDPSGARRLEAVRLAAAPSVDPLASGSRDSDGNEVLSAGLRAAMAVTDGWRLGIQGSRARVKNATASIPVDAVELQTEWRPRAALSLQTAPGIVGIRTTEPGTGTDWSGTGRARLRWRDAAGPTFEVGFTRDLLAASPLLLENRVRRTEALTRLEIPVLGGIRLRGAGRVASLQARRDSNTRRMLQGGLAMSIRPSVDFSLGFADLRYHRESADGYFAPRLAQLLEAGLYTEDRSIGPVTVALDLGAGAQRIARQGASPGAWGPALRMWSQAAIDLRPGLRLQFELESEDTRTATESTSAAGWRYGYAAASLRWTPH